MLLAPHRVVVLSAVLLAAMYPVDATSAPEYFIQVGGSGDGGFFSAVPFTRDSTGALYTSNGTGTVATGGLAHPGHVGVATRCDAAWGGVFSGGNNFGSYARATTTDFVISGPPGYVVATLHFRVVGELSRGGGFAANNAHGGRIYVNVDANVPGVGVITGGYGEVYSGNYSVTSSGILAGHDDPHVNIPFSITGSFPVGWNLGVTLMISADVFTYGNINCSPGYVESNAGGNGSPGKGLRLEEVDGQVLTLPAGYTLNSVSLGIADNHIQSMVGVEPGRPETPRLALASANPSTAGARIVLSLPHGERARVSLYDVAGRELRVLAAGWQPAGALEIDWDGRAADGTSAPPGLYFIRAQAGVWAMTRRLVLVP
jgi:hypothetical protein